MKFIPPEPYDQRVHFGIPIGDAVLALCGLWMTAGQAISTHKTLTCRRCIQKEELPLADHIRALQDAERVPIDES